MQEHIDLKRNIAFLKDYCEKHDTFRKNPNYDRFEDDSIRMTYSETSFTVTYIPALKKNEVNESCIVEANKETSQLLKEVKLTVDFMSGKLNNSSIKNKKE